MASLLAADKISKAFGRLAAVSEVSFEVEEGEIFGIAGPNGAGKTTLFNVISGLPYHADSGRIFFRGRNIESTPPHVICRLGLARTYQKETLFDTLSVLENVMVGAIYGRGEGGRLSVEERAVEALEFVGLGDRMNDEALHLALFEKKLLMLASAIATRPKLLLLDEPVAGLNKPEMDRSVELFERIKATGTTIILIEHQLPLLLKASHRVMILNYGEKLTEGPPQEVVRNETVIEAYLGKRGKRAGSNTRNQ